MDMIWFCEGARQTESGGWPKGRVYVTVGVAQVNHEVGGWPLRVVHGESLCKAENARPENQLVEAGAHAFKSAPHLIWIRTGTTVRCFGDQ